jgi:hypothetical protein
MAAPSAAFVTLESSSPVALPVVSAKSTVALQCVHGAAMDYEAPTGREDFDHVAPHWKTVLSAFSLYFEGRLTIQ